MNNKVMKTIISNSYEVNGSLYMCCHKCGSEVKGIDADTVKVTCSNCVSRMIPLEQPKGYTPTGRPAGWHWMSEFVDKDGNVFHKGKEQPKLKGTLKPTKVTPPKKTKRRTKQEMLLARNKEKKAALKIAVKKQKDFLNHKIDKG
jgi:DNA-directed RNA polymerase subunit RPC12/RpoP